MPPSSSHVLTPSCRPNRATINYKRSAIRGYELIDNRRKYLSDTISDLLIVPDPAFIRSDVEDETLFLGVDGRRKSIRLLSIPQKSNKRIYVSHSLSKIR